MKLEGGLSETAVAGVEIGEATGLPILGLFKYLAAVRPSLSPSYLYFFLPQSEEIGALE